MARLSFWLVVLFFLAVRADDFLVPGVSRLDYIPTGQWHYFQINVTGQSAVSQPTLQLTVTPLVVGDPDVWISLDTPHPNALTPGVLSSSASGEDSISIDYDHYNDRSRCPNGTAYVSVYGYVGMLYTILLNFEGTVTLLEGLPVREYVHFEQMDYFTYTLDQHDGNDVDVLIQASPSNGNIELYISSTEPPRRETPSTYQWKDIVPFSNEAKLILHNDPHFPTGPTRTFYVGVYGASHSWYQISASTNATNSTIMLRDGVAVTGRADTGVSFFYRVNVVQPNCKLTVSVSPISGGDPDLFLSTETKRPSQAQHQQAAYRYGADYMVVDPAPADTYYIGVYAYTACSYTLIASTVCGQYDNHTITWTPLMPGLPLSTFLPNGVFKYYELDLDRPTDVSISVSRRFGDPDLYITTSSATTEPPNAYNNLWSSTFSGDDVVFIHKSDSKLCQTPCSLKIGVYADTDTSFTITVGADHVSSTLADGVSVRDYLVAGDYEYFNIPVQWPVGQPSSLTIVLTPLDGGDPDMFISTHVQFPNASSYDWPSTRWRGDAITITSSDPRACLSCTYYIAVWGHTNTTFSIVASSSNFPRLQPGVPQLGSVASGAMYYFQVFVSSQQDLVVSLQTTSSYAFMFIAANDANSNLPVRIPRYNDYRTYDWWAVDYRAFKNLRIAATDSKACHGSGCSYIIGVYGVSGFNGANFTIQAATTDSTIALISGQPSQWTVFTGQYLYFSIPVTSTGMDLDIVVTPLSGDPDIFVSTRTSRPNNTFYDRYANNVGADFLDWEMTPVATYYIGVRAFLNSTFTILAQVSDPTVNRTQVVDMVEGQPISNFVHHTRWKYFRFPVDNSKSYIIFTVQPVIGDPDLYIDNDGALPSFYPAHYRWYSNVASGDIVRVSPAASGTYIAGIYGFSSSLFTLSVISSDNSLSLQNGVSQRGQLAARDIAYYNIFIDRPDVDLVIRVTAFSGDPDLYVSLVNHFPSPRVPGSWNYSAAYVGQDAVTIHHEQLTLQSSVWIGVYGFTACSFQIVATFGAHIQLQDGQPQRGNVAAYGYDYYRFAVNDPHLQLTFSLTAMSGYPSLVVSTDSAAEPTIANAQWRTGTGRLLVIDSTDRNFCGNCTYVVGVYGGFYGSSYTVYASSQHGSVHLTDGVPVNEQLEAGHWDYFRFDVPVGVTADLVVVATAMSGDPDLYISDVYEHPNSTNTPSIWQSANWATDAVAVEAAHSGTWYIGVFAYQNSSFSIVARLSYDNDTSTQTTLQDGAPQSDLLQANHWRYYTFQVVSEHTDLSVSVTRQFGDPDIYLTNTAMLPSPQNFNWSSASWGQDFIYVDHPPVGTYVLGVYAYSTTAYTVTFSTSSAMVTLLDGMTFREHLNTGEYEHFQIYVDRNDRALTISVTAFQGDPDIFVSTLASPHCPTTRPNSTCYDYAARSGLGYGDSITIAPSDLRPGRFYYISVLGYSPTSFVISATFNGAVRLQDGVTQRDDVGYEASKFYTFQVYNDGSDISFTVTPLSGYPSVYVSKSRFPNPSDYTSYQWSSSAWWTSGVRNVFIRTTDPNFCANCMYYVAVWGARASNFTIRASTSASSVPLLSQVGQFGWVNQGKYAYFTFDVPYVKADVTFMVTPLTGDPDLFITAPGRGRPSIYNYQWYAMRYGGDARHIESTDPNFAVGTYTVSVYGWTNCTFMITAEWLNATSHQIPHILLLDGSPQAEYLPGGSERSSAYFELRVDSTGNEISRDLSVSFSNIFGNPYIYASDDGSWPTPLHYKTCGRNQCRGPISIPGGCVNCIYRFLVYNIYESLFVVTASTGNTVSQLQSGVATVADVSSLAPQYYALTVTTSVVNLVITVTPLSAGNVDLYVLANSTIQRPSPTNYRWAATANGLDVLSIVSGPAPAVYSIAVVATGTQRVTFQLLATSTTGNAAIVLSDSQQQLDALSAGQTRLYAYANNDLSRSEDVTFTLSLLNTGQADIFVCANRGGASDSVPCSQNSYDWSTYPVPVTSSASGQIVIPASDGRACFNCTYYIVITPRTSSVTYGLTAAAGYSSVQQIAPGQPVISSVAAGKMRYYMFYVDSIDQDISISCATLTGDADLYVAVGTKPNTTYSQWSSTNNYAQGDLVTIPRPQKTAPAVYYIGIRGALDSTFSLTFTSTNSLLVNGLRSIGTTLGLQTPNLYSFAVGADKQDISISVSAQVAAASDFLEVYISSNHSNTVPGPTSFDRKTWRLIVNTATDSLLQSAGTHTRMSDHKSQYVVPQLLMRQRSLAPTTAADLVAAAQFKQQSTGVELGNSLYISHDDAKLCTNCVLYISVYGPVGANYSITAADDTASIHLYDGANMDGLVLYRDQKYYQMFVLEAPHLALILEPCWGNADIFVSQLYYYPNSSTSEWRGTNTDEIDIIEITSPLALYNTFYISILGQGLTSPTDYVHYRIHSNSALVPLAPPVPGNRGSLTVAVAGEGSLSISFVPATAPASRPSANPLTFTYAIWYAQSQTDAVMYSLCGLHDAKAVLAQTFTLPRDQALSANPVARTIQNLRADIPYVVNVMVYDANNTYALYRYSSPIIPSTNAPATGGGGSGVPVSTILGVGIPVLAILLAGLAFLFIKNRRLSRELNIEMKDVPTAIVRKAVGGGVADDGDAVSRPNKQDKNYNRLLTDEPSEDDLLPPPEMHALSGEPAPAPAPAPANADGSRDSLLPSGGPNFASEI